MELSAVADTTDQRAGECAYCKAPSLFSQRTVKGASFRLFFMRKPWLPNAKYLSSSSRRPDIRLV